MLVYDLMHGELFQAHTVFLVSVLAVISVRAALTTSTAPALTVAINILQVAQVLFSALTNISATSMIGYKVW